MKCFRRWWLAAALLAGAVVSRAELAEWVQHLGNETGLRSVFFRPMALPSGTIDGRRPPRETMPALAQKIAAAPTQAALYRLRAGEAELALDFAAAEADWKTYAQLTSDPIALADFYHRRLRPADEIQALDRAGTQAAFARAIQVALTQGMPDTAVIAQYRAWVARFPDDSALHKNFIRYLVETRNYTSAEREIAAYRQAFPKDESTWVEEAGLTLMRGTVDQAVAVFDKRFRPLSPWLKGYFNLLESRGRLRDFLARARAEAIAQPESLDAAARLFHYWRNAHNDGEARRALEEYRLRKKNWTAEELYTTARLFEMLQEYDEAARQYYALYSLPAADAADRERGLAGLAAVLLNAPEQAVRFGAGDLSLYRDVATMDRHPGFLNGILSLVLNTASPRWQYDGQNTTAVAYFHRARASELLDLLDAKFPQSADAPALHSKLIEAYLTYGDNEGVVRHGQRFLVAYRHAPERTAVALWMADAFARLGKTKEEFAQYDQVLAELAAKAGGVPMGPAAAARSPEYERVLDRYVARLVALERVPDALALYAAEIARNRNDPGLYEKLAAFLDQNHLGDQVERVYKSAAERFPNRSWQDRLARWYLREKRDRDFAELTRDVCKIFSGTDLERYFRSVVPERSLDAKLYREVNLYAHERFPDDLVFVKNLLAVYTQEGTADRPAYDKLLRAYWFYDDGLRARLFESLARQHKLDAELAATQHSDAAANPAAAQFYAEGEAWRGHFEAAAPVMQALAVQFPGGRDSGLRAAAVERSLGNTDAAVALARNLVETNPRSGDDLARVGDIYADRELLARSRPYWNRMAQIDPGKPEGYLDAATVFWDYYQFDDALRLIREGRAKLKNPALFAYQAGAIYEGKRNYASAVREYAKGGDEEGPARARLLELARRPARRATVNQVTANGSVRLLAAVLETEKRTKDLEALLRSLAAKETSAQRLIWIEQNAARLNFAGVEQLAIERQVAVSHDPVDRLRLRLALVRLHERHGEKAAAERAMTEILRESPAILGVVRAATDFYWRNGMQAKAIDTLATAAASANAEYRKQFTLEAARKATDAHEFARARQLLDPLLAADPFNGEYLATMAATYAQAGDDTGLRDFYRAKIDALRQAHLPADELRRGLIPALTRLDDRTGAVDQYIELINRFPEDQGLIREAATYAAGASLEPRLIAYYTKASADSAKDYRWPMVLARLQTHAENFDAAIAAYTRAIGVRPDRTDLYQSRGALEERLMRFAEAEKTYRKVWDLSYRAPAWLEKVAELEARQGKTGDAVTMLRQAWLDARPERPDTLMAIARRLESWGIMEQALSYAEQAAKGQLNDGDVATYARLLTRARRHDEVLATYGERPNAMAAMAEAVGEFYTPEEKVAFRAALEKHAGTTLNEILIRCAQRAGLRDLEAEWRANQLKAHAPQYLDYQLEELQRRRLRFEEFGRQMEEVADTRTEANGRSAALMSASRAYHAAGDLDGLARVFAKDPRDPYYLTLLAHRDPAKLVNLATSRTDAANVAIASGDAKLALDAVAAHGRLADPVWLRAYTGLAGLYYWRTAPDVSASFRAALGSGTIGERLGKTVDHKQQLAGGIWFYYGARFGEYLALRGAADAEDYLPATVEGRAGDAAAYAELADWFDERGDAKRALAEYQHALELDADQGGVQDRIAVVLWKDGRRAEAIAHWKSSLAAFEAQQGRPNLQESFWIGAPAAIEHIGERGLAPQLRTEIGSLIVAYEKRHEGYRLESVLNPAAKYGAIDLATQPEYALQWLWQAQWMTTPAKIAVLRRLIELHPIPAGEQQSYLSWDRRQVYEWRVRIGSLLLDAGDWKGAQKELAEIPETARPELNDAVELDLRIAVKAGTLDAVLQGYRRNAKTAPNANVLRAAALGLRTAKEEAAARQVLEFVYTRELDQGNFDSANFLGLAEVRLEQGLAPDALALLRRMQLISGEPFENLLPAADLLEKYHRNAEAQEFLRARVKAVPWDWNARVRLGDGLEAIVQNAQAPYPARVGAAKRAAKGGGGELDLLARGSITAAEAGRPYYYDARLAAAAGNRDASTRVRLLLDAVAIRPDDRTPLVPLLRATLDAHRDQLAETVSQSSGVPADLAQAVADACVRIGEDQRAAQVLNGAIRNSQTPAQRDRWQRELTPIEKRITLQAKNSMRQPVVSSGLEQNRIVRPRIEQ